MAPVALHPVGGFPERLRPEPAGASLGVPAAVDQPAALEHAEVLGDCGQAHVVGLGQFGDRGLAGAEAGKDGAWLGYPSAVFGDVVLIYSVWRRLIASVPTAARFAVERAAENS